MSCGGVSLGRALSLVDFVTDFTIRLRRAASEPTEGTESATRSRLEEVNA
jgi:hypothetical protein